MNSTRRSSRLLTFLPLQAQQCSCTEKPAVRSIAIVDDSVCLEALLALATALSSGKLQCTQVQSSVAPFATSRAVHGRHVTTPHFCVYPPLLRHGFLRPHNNSSLSVNVSSVIQLLTRLSLLSLPKTPNSQASPPRTRTFKQIIRGTHVE